MNTQTHIMMGAVLFGRSAPKRAWIAALGGVAPDLPMLAIVFGLKLAGYPASQIFGEFYWQEWWQRTNAIGHSFLLWGGLAILAVLMRERISASLAAIEGWTLVFLFSCSALLHTFVDFLCHREDAHMSFWPLTRWKFISPVSYWDDRHYGAWFAMFEIALGLTFAVILYRRYASPWLRGLMAVAIALYLAIPAYFIFLYP